MPPSGQNPRINIGIRFRISFRVMIMRTQFSFRDAVANIGVLTLIITLTRNKCIGDDTKAAARQSPNCIKKKN